MKKDTSSKHTKLADRELPDYTHGEEIFNMVTHIVGGALGIIVLVLCVVFSFIHKDAYAVVSSFIYGFSLIILYSMSSIYHGLKPTLDITKKVLQILDHCSIFIMISGTYTPILLCSMRKENPALAWTIFGIVWGVSVLGIILNSIDLKRYKIFSNICYIALGWCIICTLKPLIAAIGLSGFWFLLAGGIAYSLGAVLYIIAGGGKTHRYMHSIFHIFVVLASILHFICIFFFVI